MKYSFSVERIIVLSIEGSRMDNFFCIFYKKHLLFQKHDGILINVADAETQKTTKKKLKKHG
ncbi:hypothetical protein CN491_21785 [Bacillus cereus]|uniref:Uncharacterized protein n=1 Tax=Bacillus cereus TaxID=1396 RepID=A0A2A8LJJ1_BACCE|nr:hypothetical protein CN491_21785 [Bacillus cereus]